MTSSTDGSSGATLPRFPLLAEPAELVVEIDAGPIIWPPEGAVQAGLDCNRTYANFTEATWGDVDEVLPFETGIILDAIARSSYERSYWDCLDDRDDEFFDLGYGVEIGVLAASLALNAAKCPTFMSCNGHGSYCADIDFWTRPHRAEILAEAALEAGVGLGNCDGGAMKVYSDDALGLIRFAMELRGRSSALRRARGRSLRHARPRASSAGSRTNRDRKQLGLFDFPSRKVER